MEDRQFDHVGDRAARGVDDELMHLTDLLVANLGRTLGGSADAERLERHAYHAALDLWAERRPATGFVAGEALQAVRAAIARRTAESRHDACPNRAPDAVG